MTCTDRGNLGKGAPAGVVLEPALDRWVHTEGAPRFAGCMRRVGVGWREKQRVVGAWGYVVGVLASCMRREGGQQRSLEPFLACKVGAGVKGSRQLS